jgi:acyl-CoA synthetase (AMP-forming)/AMP-acid ligase II
LTIAESAVGTSSAPPPLAVERGRLRLFAKATGQTDPVYVDAAVARGHRDLPVPPTFLFGVELEQPEPFAWLSDLALTGYKSPGSLEVSDALPVSGAGKVLKRQPRER